jgi:multiple sugar transport system substrate-binding protein
MPNPPPPTLPPQPPKPLTPPTPVPAAPAPAAAPVAAPTAQMVFSKPAPGQQPGLPAQAAPVPAASQPGLPKPATPPPTLPPQPPKPLTPPTPGAPVISGGPTAASAPSIPAAPLAPGMPKAASQFAASGQSPAKPLAPTTPGMSATPGAPTASGLPPAAPPGAVPTAVRKPEVKKPPFWLFALIGVVVLAVLGYFGFQFLNPTSSGSAGKSSGTTSGTSKAGVSKAPVKQTTLVYWGLWEPTEVMSEVISDFESAHPEYKIDYRKQSHKDYRERLQTAIASGNGPDLFRFHASWVPMLKDDLAAAPNTVMTAAEFKDTFYPVAEKQLVAANKVMGIPLMYDGLALYYNKEMLKAADAEPPQTWAELKTLADTLTVPSDKAERSRGKLQRAGLAIGNATNVEHFADILGLLILQNGGDPAAPTTPEVRDALLFYTNFIKEDQVWSEAMPSSTVAFARGDVAMMFAPSWRALDVKAMNPELDFGVTTVPKLGDQHIGWASYWAEGVNQKSKNQAGAWEFIKYMSSADVQKKFFSVASGTRSFGEIYSRQDLAKELQTDPVIASILTDAPVADSWYLSSFTHDNGLNDQLIKYYGDAITATVEDKNIDEVLATLATGTKQVLRQYGLSQ